MFYVFMQLKRNERVLLGTQALEDSMRIQLNGRNLAHFSKHVNEYTNMYLKRDGHMRCDDPFVGNRMPKLYKKMLEEDDDSISHLSSLF